MDSLGLTKVIVRMPSDLHEAVKVRAEEEERSMAQTIRRAIRAYLGDPSGSAPAPTKPSDPGSTERRDGPRPSPASPRGRAVEPRFKK